MAIQPKKKRTTSKAKSTVKKKPATKKTTSKRTKRKPTKKSNLKRNIWVVSIFVLMVSILAYGYYLGKKSENETLQFSEIFEGESGYTTKQLLEELAKAKQKKTSTLKKIHKKQPKKQVKPKVTKMVKKVKTSVTPSQNIKKIKLLPQKIALIAHTKKPKLAIVIDDVSHRRQLNAIQNIGMKLTPSIFPPSELSMSSNHLADNLKHYMIHLPMESGSRQFNSQYKTLMTSFSSTQIENRAKELRRLFPHGHYVNNHTGSVFTANFLAMKRLYKALRDEGFVFIDSLTTGTSKVHIVSNMYGDTYVTRDIFIDNIHTIAAIHTQLKKAVYIAKKKGYAIAIGHPHSITMKALKSANDILKDVELVYIDELFKE
jgi:polysaccharide deacetylase 2 family uncharacterized protein YibQ